MIQQAKRPADPARLPADRFPLLITGLPGVPGYNAFDYFRARYPGQVIGIRQQDNWRMNGEGIIPCDAEDPRQMALLFDKYQFRSVLDCAGNCALRACELCPDIAWRINVEGLRNFLATIGDSDVRLVHLSCDLVFSGERPGDYREDDPTDPVTVYGKTMAAAEQLLLEKNPAACTLRISLPMGVSFNGHAGAIDWIQSRFRKSKPATLYFDEIRTPTYTDCLNVLYETMLGNDLAGIFHAGGPRRLTLYQIAQVINRVGGYAPEHVMGCLRHQAGPIPPRAGNVSMDSSKLTSGLGHNPIDPWPLSEDLVPTHHDWHHERPGDQPGSLEFLNQVLYRNPGRRNSQCL
jgi:dTDP-4-dehydrorhamnose reductase